MSGLRRVDGSLYDAAHELIEEWRERDPDAQHLVLILEHDDTVEVTLLGDAPIKPSAVAGLCFTAAGMAVE